MVDVQPVAQNQFGDDTHPAFGVAIVSRSSNMPGEVLFQSDVKHPSTIRIEIHEASRKRSLNSDWVHSGKLVTEIELSAVQWGALVSGIGGGGVPVTIRYRDGERVPHLPFQPRMEESIKEATTSVDELMAPIKEALDALDAAEDSKAGVKERRELRRQLRFKVEGASNHASYAVDQLNRQTERTVAQARADIEALIMDASRRAGMQFDQSELRPGLEGGE